MNARTHRRAESLSSMCLETAHHGDVTAATDLQMRSATADVRVNRGSIVHVSLAPRLSLASSAT